MKPHQSSLRKSRRSIPLAAALIVFSACADDAVVPMQNQSAGGAAKTEFGREAPKLRGAVASAPSADAATSAPPPADQVANVNAAAIVSPTMVIRNGSATVEVDSLELAIAAVQKLAASMGGYIGNTTQTTGANSVRSADLELKIPSARYDAAVGGLTPIGKVESQTSTAEDVGEEFVDVTARQANARRLEERLITLLATRTGKLEDVLAVERELARVREEIERYEGRLRYLKSHVATSTLVVNLHEKRAVVGGYEGTNIIAESFKNAWRIFVQFIAFLISSLGLLIPLGAFLAVAAYIAKRVRRNAKLQAPTSIKPKKDDASS